MEKPKNVYVQLMDMNKGAGVIAGGGGAGRREIKGGNWNNSNSISMKYTLKKFSTLTILKL